MGRQIDVALLFDGRPGAADLCTFTGTQDVESALRTVGETIATNPAWGALSCARLVGRVRPEPILAVFGSFSDVDRFRLSNLAVQLNHTISHFRYIDYRAAESAVRSLADRLAERFEATELDAFRFAAIPRGGLIVLGMLSYVLGIRADQLVSVENAPPDRVLVIVDDCALSGFRLRQVISAAAPSRFVFCPLFSPPELCPAIERAEPRVIACLRGEDLADLAPLIHGERYREWVEERRALSGGKPYWIGHSEPIGLPWGEPTTNVWNPCLTRFEAGWKLMPIERRLSRHDGQRSDSRDGAGVSGVNIVEPGSGPIRAADRVVWAELGSSIAVALIPEAGERETMGAIPCFRLDGSAADIWRLLLRWGALDPVRDALGERYGLESLPPDGELERFVDDLHHNRIISSG